MILDEFIRTWNIITALGAAFMFLYSCCYTLRTIIAIASRDWDYLERCRNNVLFSVFMILFIVLIESVVICLGLV